MLFDRKGKYDMLLPIKTQLNQTVLIEKMM
jgi:hypothetical protein